MKPAETPLLEIRDVSISFEGDGKYLHAVNKASLYVDRGEIVGLIGQSGSGKTTLMMGILGLLRGSPGVWKGEAFLDGKPLLPPCEKYVSELSHGRIHKRGNAFLNAQNRLWRDLRGREVAVIFQEPRAALDPYFKVGEHMLEALRRAGVQGSKAGLRAHGLEFLYDAGLVDAGRVWDLYPHEISGGMAQRVMVAMALCARPKLLVADEPSTALDVTTQAKLLELLLRLRKKYGLSILFISHDIGVIQEICSRVYVLYQGSVVENGETSEVLRHYRHSYTGDLVRAFMSLGQHSIGKDGHTVPSPVIGDSETPLMEVRNIRKCFRREGKSFLALDCVSLSLREGETYALAGESGSGKSTLALSMLALQGVDGGEIFFRGENFPGADKARMRELRRQIRLLFQHPEAVLNGGMTVSAIISEGLEKDGELNRAEIRQRVLEALEQVRLDPGHGKRFPANLSSGEKQRVTIARALITRPRLLVCDEPMANLDLVMQGQILELLRGLQQRLGLTYLLISHNLELVKSLAHRIGVMYMGRIVEEATAGDFTMERARHPYTKLLLASAPSMGDERQNRIRAEFPDVEPIRMEAGCPFRNRCPWYLESRHPDCETLKPCLRAMANGGRAACHLAGG